MITLRDILDLEPCYRADEVEALWAEHAGDRESVRPSELMGIVPDDDAMWALVHLAPERLAREAACDWAERALRLAGVEDTRSWAAVEVARRHARGEVTDGDLEDAWRAAYDAAMATACGVAVMYAAIYAACSDPVWGARAASTAAAGYVARVAGGDAAWDAACRGMLLDLVERMEAAL